MLKKKISEKPTSLSSSIKPTCCSSGLVTTRDCLCIKSDLKLEGKEVKIETLTIYALQTPENVVSMHQWGSVIFWLRKVATNEYNLEESGPLQFGAEFSSAVKSFYDAILYVSKKSKQTPQLTLPESIKLAASTVKLFSNMQSSKEDLYSGRKSFYYSDGRRLLTV